MGYQKQSNLPTEQGTKVLESVQCHGCNNWAVFEYQEQTQTCSADAFKPTGNTSDYLQWHPVPAEMHDWSSKR